MAATRVTVTHIHDASCTFSFLIQDPLLCMVPYEYSAYIISKALHVTHSYI